MWFVLSTKMQSVIIMLFSANSYCLVVCLDKSCDDSLKINSSSAHDTPNKGILVTEFFIQHLVFHQVCGANTHC